MLGRVRRPRGPRPGQGGRRRRPAGAPGRDRRAGRRVGLRQDHARADPARAGAADRGHRLVRRAAARLLEQGAVGVPPSGPARPAGPQRVAQPAADGLRRRCRGPADPRRCRRRADRGRRGPVPGRPAATGAVLLPLPARAVRRPAPAGGDRRRAGAAPDDADRRRAGRRRSTRRSAARSWPCCCGYARTSACRLPGGHPRPRAWPGTSPTGWRSCTSAGSWRPDPIEKILSAPNTPTPRRCSRWCRT